MSRRDVVVWLQRAALIGIGMAWIVGTHALIHVFVDRPCHYWQSGTAP